MTTEKEKKLRENAKFDFTSWADADDGIGYKLKNKISYEVLSNLESIYDTYTYGKTYGNIIIPFNAYVGSIVLRMLMLLGDNPEAKDLMICSVVAEFMRDIPREKAIGLMEYFMNKVEALYI